MLFVNVAFHSGTGVERGGGTVLTVPLPSVLLQLMLKPSISVLEQWRIAIRVSARPGADVSKYMLSIGDQQVCNRQFFELHACELHERAHE